MTVRRTDPFAMADRKTSGGPDLNVLVETRTKTAASAAVQGACS